MMPRTKRWLAAPPKRPQAERAAPEGLVHAADLPASAQTPSAKRPAREPQPPARGEQPSQADDEPRTSWTLPPTLLSLITQANAALRPGAQPPAEPPPEPTGAQRHEERRQGAQPAQPAQATRPKPAPGPAAPQPPSPKPQPAAPCAPIPLRERWQRWRAAGKAGSAASQEQRLLRPEDLRFLSSVQEAQVAESRPWANAALWLMLSAVAIAGLWAASTQVEQITRAEARVVPDGREQVIASLEGGILRELLVREGARVQPGQVLVRLDPTRFESQQNEGDAKRLALKASVARLRAEASGRPLQFPPELAGQARLIASETEAFRSRQSGVAEAVAANQHSIALVQRELSMAESMAAKGLMSEVEVMRLKRQIGEMQQQSAERRSRFRQEASTELLRAQAELAQLDEQMVAREDQLRRTELNSPVEGLVKNIRISTLGGVVNPGAPIMEIVPLGKQLRVEARIKPADIGFVHVGQSAEVKLSAYEYNLYGGLHGVVEAISPDALGDTERTNPSAAGSADATWFRAQLRIERSSLAASGQALEVLPGMTGTVEINTGERSVLDFILRPLLKAREAFRER